MASRVQGHGHGGHTEDGSLGGGGDGPRIENVDSHVGPQVDARHDKIDRTAGNFPEPDLDAVRRGPGDGVSVKLPVFSSLPYHERPGKGDGVPGGAPLHFGRHDEAVPFFGESLLKGEESPGMNAVVIGEEETHVSPPRRFCSPGSTERRALSGLPPPHRSRSGP